ncbi:MAG TPA: site-2 protease family protein, partial [Actinomycetales bacterium]
MAPAQRPGIPLGRVVGVPIYLAPSWFIVAAVVVVVFEPTVARVADVDRPQTFVVAAAFAVLLLLSVLVHELSHAGVALRLRMPVKEIVLTLWGGHTQFEDDAPTPGRSAAVAVVGPLSNGVLALLGLIALTQVDGGVSSLLIGALVVTNAFVAVFNLAPGLPLDGGRVVESAGWKATGRRSAGTRIAGWCGRVVAVLVVLWAIGWPLLAGRQPSLFSVIWSVLIASMLWQGASAAIAVARLRQEAEGLDLRAFTVPAVASPVSAAAWQLLRPADDVHVVAVDESG